MIALLLPMIKFMVGGWFDYKAKRAKTETERLSLINKRDINLDNLKAGVLKEGAFYFQLFFIVPLGLWFAAVILYSVFWCNGCAYPQDWTVAALPSPLNEWAAGIIAFLFLTKGK